MAKTERRIAREWKTIQAMVRIYCRAHHAPDSAPCAECEETLEYAKRRLDKCPYGGDKPTCAKCPIHCYSPSNRERVREIMRFAGPRMLPRHPILAILHLLDGRREAPERPKQKGREGDDADT